LTEDREAVLAALAVLVVLTADRPAADPEDTETAEDSAGKNKDRYRHTPAVLPRSGKAFGNQEAAGIL
jgi:hypothetical protein